MSPPAKKIPFLIRESTVLSIVAINSVILFLAAFPSFSQQTLTILHQIDYVCVLFFVYEAAAKIRLYSFRRYWASAWNKLDFMIVLAGLPVLIDPFSSTNFEAFSVILLFRMGRFLRFFRMMRFVPNAAHIWVGIVRSLKASVGVFLVLLLLNLLLAMGANMLFQSISPEHFGNPLISLYTIFKVFTVEGWYEIPEMLAAKGIASAWITGMKLYLSFSVLTGGILGLSLANAVFVDEMTADNNRQLEYEVSELRLEISLLKETLSATTTANNKLIAEIHQYIIPPQEPH